MGIIPPGTWESRAARPGKGLGLSPPYEVAPDLAFGIATTSYRFTRDFALSRRSLIQNSEFLWPDRRCRRFGRSLRVPIRSFAIAGRQLDMDLTHLVRRRALGCRVLFQGAPFQIIPLRLHVDKFTLIRAEGTHQC